MNAETITMIPERIITLAHPDARIWTIDRIYSDPLSAVNALELLAQSAPLEADRAAARLGLATALAVVGQLDRADELLDGVEAYYLSENDLLLHAHAKLRHNVVYLQQGDFPFAIDRLISVVDVARAHADHWLEAASLSDIAMLRMRNGEMAEGVATMFECVAIADLGDDVMLKTVVNMNLAAAMFELHDHRAAASIAERVLSALPPERELPLQFEGNSLLAACLEQLGEFDRAIEHLELARQCASDLAYPFGLAESTYDEARLWHRLDRIDDARGAFCRAIEHLRVIDTPTRDVRIAQAEWWLEHLDHAFTRTTLDKLVCAYEANPKDAYSRSFDLHEAIAESADALGLPELAIKHLRESRKLTEAYWSELGDRQTQVALRRFQLESARRTAEHERSVRQELATALDVSEELNRTNQSLLEQLQLKTLELERQAIEDPLTQIGNRRHFVDRLDTEVARSLAFGHPVTVALADIDNFKEINDRHSHCTGDKVLREVAQILTAQLREIDTVARYGGEEFGFILPEATLESATHLLERARSAIASHNWRANGIDLDVSISVGVTRCSPTVSANDIVARADRLLYQAKRSGKNRICSSEEVAFVEAS